jgi:hypothetical protein
VPELASRRGSGSGEPHTRSPARPPSGRLCKSVVWIAHGSAIYRWPAEISEEDCTIMSKPLPSGFLNWREHGVACAAAFEDARRFVQQLLLSRRSAPARYGRPVSGRIDSPTWRLRSARGEFNRRVFSPGRSPKLSPGSTSCCEGRYDRGVYRDHNRWQSSRPRIGSEDTASAAQSIFCTGRSAS